MKASLILLCLSLLTVAYAQELCTGNGMPTCTADNNAVEFRNFEDPTRYWKCQDNTPTVVSCDGLGYMQSKGCIPWSDWSWEPCN